MNLYENDIILNTKNFVNNHEKIMKNVIYP